MKILVCFKATYELDYLTEEEIKGFCNGAYDLSFARRTIGTYDESALELGLLLRDMGTQDVECCALCVGRCEARIAQQVLATGYRHVYQAYAKEELEYNPHKVAHAAASCVKEKGPFDAVLMGQQAGIGQCGQVHAILAELLGWPCISNVRDLNIENGMVRATHKVRGGLCQKSVAVPAVYAVGECEHPYLRMPTLREKLKVSKKETELCAPDEWRQTTGALTLLRYLYDREERQCLMLDGKNAEEKTQALLNAIRIGEA